jgi:hypothetical protein
MRAARAAGIFVGNVGIAVIRVIRIC